MELPQEAPKSKLGPAMVQKPSEAKVALLPLPVWPHYLLVGPLSSAGQPPLKFNNLE